jgi:DNA polymerase-4
MALAAAERKVKDLTVLPPDPAACETMNRELERIAAVYAPVYESDKQGKRNKKSPRQSHGVLKISP